MFSVYILENDDGRFYIGSTNNLKIRIAEHNDRSRNGWAARRGPWRLVHNEKFAIRADAMRHERYLKSLKSKSAILELFKK